MKERDDDVFSLLDYSHYQKPIISFVGAGGKTSLIKEHALYFQKQKKRVLITTTTHMFKEEQYFCSNKEQVKQRFLNYEIVMVGQECGEGKIKGLNEDVLKEYIDLADVILIEADGAKRRPCKAPRFHEPQILKESQYVVGVVGLDCLDSPINDVCFGIDELCRLLHKQKEDYLNEEDLCLLLTSKQGTYKDVGDRYYYVALNKTYSFNKVNQAKRIKECIEDRVDGVIIL